jgi:hypothetical protein
MKAGEVCNIPHFVGYLDHYKNNAMEDDEYDFLDSFYVDVDFSTMDGNFMGLVT